MAITINYITNEILVPKSDTTLLGIDPISGREQRQLDVLEFKTALGDLQDNQSDVWAPTAFENTAPQDLGSIVLGRSLIILAPYFVTFEAGDYSVNLVNGNSNIITRTTINGVVPIPNNSVGLAQVSTGSGLSTEQDTRLTDIHSKLPSDGEEIAGQNDTSGGSSGSSVWTELEKDQLILDLETTKRQATKSANNTEHSN